MLRTFARCLLLLACALAQAAQASPRRSCAFGSELNPRIERRVRVPADAGRRRGPVRRRVLDNARFPAPADQLMADHLRTRYADKRIDLVLTVDSIALRFLLRNHARAFPGVPVVFSGIRTTTLANIALPANFVGVPPGCRAHDPPCARAAARGAWWWPSPALPSWTGCGASFRAAPLPPGVAAGAQRPFCRGARTRARGARPERSHRDGALSRRRGGPDVCRLPS